MHPAEHGGQDQALPRVQLDQPPLARPLALNVGQQLQEVARPLGPVGIEHPRPAVAGLARQVVELAVDGQPRPLAGRIAPDCTRLA